MSSDIHLYIWYIYCRLHRIMGGSLGSEGLTTMEEDYSL